MRLSSCCYLKRTGTALSVRVPRCLGVRNPSNRFMIDAKPVTAQVHTPSRAL